MRMKTSVQDVKLVLECLKVKTDCFNECGNPYAAKYLVCIDDDITSAFYAMDMYFMIYQCYGYYPKLLCVGGVGPLSKYTNENGVSEGMKQAYACRRLGAREESIVVLDNGTNTGLNLKDIVFEVAKEPGTVIMCLTERLSLRLKLTLEYLPHQYPEISEQLMEQMFEKGVYYYVPEQKLSEQMAVFNCKGLANGVMFFSEIASIYDRIERYSGKLQAPLDFEVPQEVVDAAHRLAKAYRLKMPGWNLRKLIQFVKAYRAVKGNAGRIAEKTEKAIQTRALLLKQFINH